MPTFLSRLWPREGPEEPSEFNGDPAKTLAAKALHSILRATLCFGVLYLALVVPFFVVKKPAASVYWAVIIAVTAACMLLLRRGYVRLSGWIFLSTAWLMLALFVLLSGGITSPALLSHIAVIVVSAWLVGRRAATWIAALSLAFVLSLTILESAGLHLPRYFPSTPVVAWAIAAVLIGLALLPHANLSEALVDSARQARRELEAHRREERIRAESDERFRNIADSAPVMIWVSGLDKLCTFFNEPWLDFTGRAMEQELGNGWAEGVHPHDLDRCLAIYTSSFDARHPFQMEYRLRRADGEYRWVLDNGIPHYRDSAFVGYIGSCIDVTEQKLMAERLRGQQIQLADAQRLARLGSWGRNIETGRIEYSDETFRILGISPGGPAPTLTAYLELVHPNDREKVREAAAGVPSSMAPVELSYRIIRPDGDVRFLRTIVEAIRDNRGAPVRTVGSMQDVTEQVMAEQLLLESEERLKNAERLAHVGYWHWELANGQLVWSEECLRIFGRPGDYKPNKEEFFQMVAPQDREMVTREVRHTVSAKRGDSMEFRIVRPDGDLRTVMTVSEVLMNEEGSPARVFGAVQDVTDLRRTQEQTMARQKLESLGTLANGIAHDFNNLLGGVLAQAELALSEVAAGLNPEEELRAIRDVAIRGSEIVRELMIYAGKESAAEGLVDVSRIVREMLELLKVSVSKHAVLETDLGDGLPPVRANAAQLRQIVMNLVTNASDAIGDRDGVIRLTTGAIYTGKTLSIASLAAGDYVELAVSDTGCGIPPEAQAKVFDPFFTSKSAGHGLGLAIVDGIVRSLGGTIHLTSESGKGTTFQIWLPVASTAAVTTGATILVEEAPKPSRVASVLVVEDEVPLRQAVTKMLRRTGFEVLEAPDGTSALALVRANRGGIDLILLDVTIPGASSAQVVAEAAQAQPAPKVILTSAYSQETLPASMNASEVAGFIRKPFQLGDLVRALRNALSL